MPRVIGVDLMRELTTNPPEGLSPVRTRLRNEAIALIKAEALVENAAYSYNIVPLDAPPAELLKAGGESIFAPQLLPDSGEITSVGCGVCTLGPEISNRSTSLFAEKRASLAVALDDVANEMLFALGRRIQDRMLSECYRKRLSMGAELHAGDPGLDLDAQAAVFRLAQGDSIGVSIHRGQMLAPVKSSSVIFAVGKQLPEVSWSRCDSCPSRLKCNYGRRSTSSTNSSNAITASRLPSAPTPAPQLP